MDRHAEVRDRLARWDKYRQEQAVLLAWLRDTEKERASLQLRYIHLRLLPKVLLHIQVFLFFFTLILQHQLIFMSIFISVNFNLYILFRVY